MKKTLSILLVLMLVLVPVTAMATEGVVGIDPFDSNKQAETHFNVEVDTSNISVTVPLSLVFVANANGGLLKAPTATAYQITNNSTIALKVASISTDALTTPTGATTAPTFSATATLTPGTNNMFYMTLNGQVLSAAMSATSLTGTIWNIPANGACGIAVVGSSTTLDFVTTETAATLFTVTYTIAPGANQ